MPINNLPLKIIVFSHHTIYCDQASSNYKFQTEFSHGTFRNYFASRIKQEQIRNYPHKFNRCKFKPSTNKWGQTWDICQLCPFWYASQNNILKLEMDNCWSSKSTFQPFSIKWKSILRYASLMCRCWLAMPLGAGILLWVLLCRTIEDK